MNANINNRDLIKVNKIIENNLDKIDLNLSNENINENNFNDSGKSDTEKVSIDVRLNLIIETAPIKKKLKTFTNNIIDLNALDEKIYIIYKEFIEKHDVLAIEHKFNELIKDKIELKSSDAIAPNALNEEGSIMMENSYFWILIILIQLSKTNKEFKSEIFFKFVNYAIECCERNLGVFKHFIENSLEDIVSRESKTVLSDENKEDEIFPNSYQTDLIDSLKNFDIILSNEKLFKIGKKRKLNKENKYNRIKNDDVLSHEKIDLYNCKSNFTNSSTLQQLKIDSVINLEYIDDPIGRNCNNKIDMKNLMSEIIANQNLSSIKVHQFTYIKISAPQTKEINYVITYSNCFSILPTIRTKRRISFVNNFEQADCSISPNINRNEDYLDEIIWKKMGNFRDTEISCDIYDEDSKNVHNNLKNNKKNKSHIR